MLTEKRYMEKKLINVLSYRQLAFPLPSWDSKFAATDSTARSASDFVNIVVVIVVVISPSHGTSTAQASMHLCFQASVHTSRRTHSCPFCVHTASQLDFRERTKTVLSPHVFTSKEDCCGIRRQNTSKHLAVVHGT